MALVWHVNSVIAPQAQIATGEAIGQLLGVHC